MPYSTVDQLPNHLKVYNEVTQRQWMHVFNSVYESTHDEVRALKAANSVLKNRFTKKDSMEKNSHGDYMQMLVNSFLGNLD